MSGTRDEVRVDDLRRRLYRADATPEDLERYLAERPPEEPPALQPEPRRPASRARPLRIAIGAGLVLVVVAAFVVATRPSPAPRAAVATVAAPTTSLVLPRRDDLMVEDIGEGRTLTFDPSAANGPIAVPADVDDTAVVGRRYFGAGNALLAFDALPGTSEGGRMTVTLTSPSPSSVRWSALLFVVPAGRFASPLVIASGRGATTVAEAQRTFLYPNRPATQVAIEAPDGVGWTITVGVAGGLPSPTAAFTQ